MVFLRPVVIRDAASSDALSNNRYQQMMGLQQTTQPGFNPILGSGNAPVLPPAPVPAPVAPAAPVPAPATSSAAQ